MDLSKTLTSHITFMITEKERKFIERKAKKEGISMNLFVRKILWKEMKINEE